MLRLRKELVHGRLLRLASRVHDDHAVRDVRDDAEVVRDQDDRRAEALADVAHQVEDAGLDRDVERGRRLVGDQDLRVARERHRDHHALAHAARELVRILVDAPVGSGDAHEVEQLDRAAARVAPRQAEMAAQHLADLVADLERRVERRHRLLEDERDLAAADARGAATAGRAAGRCRRTRRGRRRPRSPGSSRSSDMKLTLLPQPDSPTTPSTSRSPSVKDSRSTAWT